MVRKQKSLWILIVLLLAGAAAGTVVGSALGMLVPVIGESLRMGLEPPVTIDLVFFSLTFGCGLDLNIGSALGLLAAALIYRRL